MEATSGSRGHHFPIHSDGAKMLPQRGARVSLLVNLLQIFIVHIGSKLHLEVAILEIDSCSELLALASEDFTEPSGVSS
jgi:hypothetical protein